MTALHLLRAHLERAGAEVVERNGVPLPLHFGSVAAELAVCTTAIGLAWRPDLTVRWVRGASRVIDVELARRAGRDLAVGQALRSPGTWWCRVASRALMTVEFGSSGAVANEWQHSHGLLVDDGSELVALSVVGPAVGRLLADLGCPVSVVPGISLFNSGAVSGLLLSEESHHATLVIKVEQVEALWITLVTAGKRFRLSCVGLEALQRLSQRARRAAHDDVAAPVMRR